MYIVHGPPLSLSHTHTLMQGGMSSDPTHFAGKPPSTWDIRVFVQALQSILPNLNWREVILYLDYPEFHLSSPEGLNLIVSTFKLATRYEREIFLVPYSQKIWQFGGLLEQPPN